MRSSCAAAAAMLHLLTLGAVTTGCDSNLSHPTRASYTGADPQPLSCLPNLDGRIDASELQAAVGIPVSNVVSPPGVSRAFDLAGAVGTDGRQSWDWGNSYADDQLARIQASSVSGQWFAGSFPEGQFAAPVDAAGRTLAIYKHTDEALWLLGLATPVEHPPEGKTLIVYDAPVALYRFPLEVGKSWVSAGVSRNGVIRDLPYAGRDTYQVKVDAAGRLKLPDLTFEQALRVRTDVTVEPAVGPTVSRKQISFLFECYGEVARATSQDGEQQADFTNAAELRRLSLETDE